MPLLSHIFKCHAPPALKRLDRRQRQRPARVNWKLLSKFKVL